MAWSSLRYDNSYHRLPGHFYSRVEPGPVPAPYLIHLNDDVAKLIGLNPQSVVPEELLSVLSGNQLEEQHLPLSMLYAGHQFGHWVPQLGDGRAIQIAEIINTENERWALQLKGAGPTPYSRNADGRAVLRSSIREYLCSEAVHGLGIPTTRALSIVGSDMEIYREEIESAAILLRTAPSFVRFGHFEVFASRGLTEDVKRLADYIIEHHYPDFQDKPEPYVQLFTQVVDSTARLIAQWQAAGFMHGVMNTDNMSIHGLTIDYGPFGFMDAYDPAHICNHTDTQGRYAFNNQPQIGLWNLMCLAESFTSLISREQLKEILSEYEMKFATDYTLLMRKKLGLFDEAQTEDAALINDLLAMMKESRADYTNTFRALSMLSKEDGDIHRLRDQFIDIARFTNWLEKYTVRIDELGMSDDIRNERMKQQNPKYVLRNYLLQEAIDKAKQKDYSEIGTLLKLISSPYEEHKGFEHYSNPPPEWASQLQVSCSS